MSGVLIAANNLCLQMGSREILNNISIEVKQGEIVTLIGPNGAGKTSLIRVLLGLSKAQGDIQRKKDLRVGYVPQRVLINEHLPLRVRDFLSLEKQYSDKEMKEVLEQTGVSALMDAGIQQISGGEMQRVLLARALLKSPELLVLDEPAQGVDIIGQQSLYKTIKAIRDKQGCAVLMVSHDLHLVMAATDQVICMNTHICCSGHPDDVSEHPEYLKLFGDALEGLALYSHHHDHEHDIHGDVIDVHNNDHEHSHACNHSEHGQHHG